MRGCRYCLDDEYECDMCAYELDDDFTPDELGIDPENQDDGVLARVVRALRRLIQAQPEV